MRTILTLFVISILIFAQTDFNSLDIESYNYFLKGDYDNLRKTAEKQFSLGYDYYYLSMRLGILAYNNQDYSNAFEHFQKAITFSNDDPVSNEYIYHCYLYSGRYSDAHLFLSSLSNDQKTDYLKYLSSKDNYKFSTSLSFVSNDYKDMPLNLLYYEAIKKTLSYNVGSELYLSDNVKLNLMYTRFQKSGKFYNFYESTGEDKTFNQDQLYSKISFLSYPGLELYAYGHFAFFSIKNYRITPSNNIISKNQNKTESAYGLGITKNFWNVRFTSNISLSNFGNSNQTRGEISLTYLPNSNLNFYTTTSAMFQKDKNWGNTYFVAQDLGFKTLDNLWLETGVSLGNSYLFTFLQGLSLNNSFTIPSFSLYLNGIILLNNNFTLYITPYFVKKTNYSWDLLNHKSYDKINTNSNGVSISLIYKR